MPADCGAWLEGLRAPESRRADQFRILVVVAHPDDESLGAGAALAYLPGARLLHVTDGAPHDRQCWGAPDTPTREAYARLRRAELGRAMSFAGVGPERIGELGWVDQECARDLVSLTHALQGMLAAEPVDLVLVHPYEGGHPDHDSVAFAVHTARTRLREQGAEPPRVIEFAGYHAGPEGIATGRFLPADTGEEWVAPFDDADRERKRRMIDCFQTQQQTLAQFGAAPERFRIAPEYDFAAPPHPGRLYYESYAWGTTGAEWRERARDALRALGLAGAGCR